MTAGTTEMAALGMGLEDMTTVTVTIETVMAGEMTDTTDVIEGKRVRSLRSYGHGIDAEAYGNRPVAL